ncbi:MULTISPECIES: phosphate ABC transporter permease PstA [Microbacterium]|uniref:Phosphate transport system permease protein PstA n=1 Tax=Microbacterium algeriense TaxID=2615184 RepID=A0ABQ6VB16_9MICO|nr:MULTISPECIES: phosphate ABC transporter permease PstA [Microbacterium]AZH79472.1 phosphate ABC transporter, permease protein PstA [Microbacterium sp. Y-01]KAB1867277.1 phosphate ABC transporter permease PstA [Microbacterium algeriense]MDX2399529.1 phosphate ABC transporter permease PstA [Microbacterium algeriense]
MTVTAPESTRTVSAAAPPVSLNSGHLPRWAPWGLLALSLLIGFTPFALEALASGSDLNIAGSVVLGAVIYLVLIYVMSRIIEGARKALDRLITGIVTSAFAIAMVPLVSVAVTVVANGLARFDGLFFSSSMRGVLGEGGGALHAIIGTLLVTLAAAVISIPIGLMTAVYLVEYGQGGRMARTITFLVDVMTGIPSIVAGLFAYAVFALIFGPGVRMGIAGSVALAVLMIPVVVRSTEEMLRLVPNELREASYALGVPKWLTIVKVVLPTSIAGITTGVMLAISRVIGETAPLLLTAGFTDAMNYNLFSGRMQTLPVFTYSQYAYQGIPAEAYVERAWAAALTLIIIVMLLNLIARLVAKIFAPKTGR